MNIIPETQVVGDLGLPPQQCVSIDGNSLRLQSCLSKDGIFSKESNIEDSSFSNNRGTAPPTQGSEHEEEMAGLVGTVDLGSVDHYDPICVKAASFFPFPTCMEYFLGGKLIDASNREAVELSIHTKAFRIVSTDQTARAAVLADIMVSEDKNFMQSLDSHLFLLSSFCDDMMQRLHGVRKDGFKAKTLWMKWQSTLTPMKKIFAGFPRNYHTIKS